MCLSVCGNGIVAIFVCFQFLTIYCHLIHIGINYGKCYGFTVNLVIFEFCNFRYNCINYKSVTGNIGNISGFIDNLCINDIFCIWLDVERTTISDFVPIRICKCFYFIQCQCIICNIVVNLIYCSVVFCNNGYFLCFLEENTKCNFIQELCPFIIGYRNASGWCNLIIDFKCCFCCNTIYSDCCIVCTNGNWFCFLCTCFIRIELNAVFCEIISGCSIKCVCIF